MQTLRNILFVAMVLALHPALAQERFVAFTPTSDAFALASQGEVVPLLIDSVESMGLRGAVESLRTDIERVVGQAPATSGNRAVIVGQLGAGGYADRLAAAGVFDRTQLEGKREKFLITTLLNPLPGVDEALLIVGSDMRGAIYGVYTLSEQMGVSPWYWWADVPVESHSDIYIIKGTFSAGEPAVKYRGIFLNDEAPALTGWVRANYGGYNSQFYEKVFELLLRLKANFLWPAMWDAAFYDDDPRNSLLAAQMGIVMGTSHHEPMARAHKEWRRYGKGVWNYQTNAKELDAFWRAGVDRMKSTEDLVTIGMRGDGDEPMSEQSNIRLLERIVKSQRATIERTTGRKASETPQVWALYKEVQEYYDRGMRVPDDVTLLLCDDNWGNVRKLPALGAAPRKGGYGMYYHFDYVGGPRNYKWLNVSQIQRIWEQMNLTYEYGVRELWIVNVGDLKPMEYPIQFFLDMAWDPTQFNPQKLIAHTEAFCREQFGAEYASEAARIIDTYTRYNRRVTPELLDASTYSLHNYNEFQGVVEEYNALLLDALKLYYRLPSTHRDAFDQLVLFPVQACANLYEMYYAVAMNRDLAKRGDVQANDYADRAEACFVRDAELCRRYNEVISGGKWNHMMDQNHIGYTNWQQPEVQKMPEVVRVAAKPTSAPCFVEAEGYVSIEAEHFARSRGNAAAQVVVIPGLGKSLSGVTPLPAAIPAQEDPADGIWVEWDVELARAGDATLTLLLCPTLNYNDNKGLRYAVSWDGGAEQVVNFNGSYTEQEHGKWLAQSIIRSQTTHHFAEAGRHTLRLRWIDAGMVVQKLLLDNGGLKESYLGAPESENKNKL